MIKDGRLREAMGGTGGSPPNFSYIFFIIETLGVYIHNTYVYIHYF